MRQNKMKLEKLAYAKINLYLDVLSKMENGYHEIESVMQSVSLCDKITLDITNCDDFIVDISAEGLTIPNDKTNLIYRATEGFFTALANKTGKKYTGKFNFLVEKNIPIGAGMAGGSADCACALRLLNEAYHFPFTSDELLAIGGKIGADVSFCLTGGTAICKGVGEKITPLSPLEDVFLVCAIDNSSVSTPVAFKMLDDEYGISPLAYGKLDDIVNAINKKDLKAVATHLYNKFEGVIARDNENVKMIKQTLLKNGAIGAIMSGSGPSVFGIFDKEKDQINAYKALKSNEIRAFLCKTV